MYVLSKKVKKKKKKKLSNEIFNFSEKKSLYIAWASFHYERTLKQSNNQEIKTVFIVSER